MTDILEHTRVVALVEKLDQHVERGDIGSVVHIHDNGIAFVVEFASGELVTFRDEEVRSLTSEDRLYVRL